MKAVIIKNIITHFHYSYQIANKGLMYSLLFAISLLFISLISSRQSRFCALILPKGR
jgi:hypothetical protein